MPRDKSKKDVSLGKSVVRHAHLWGLREVYEDNASEEKVLVAGKYHWLNEHDVTSTDWERLRPESPSYLFVSQDRQLKEEYENGWKINDAMPVNSAGIVTARDNLVVQFEQKGVWETVNAFIRLSPEQARNRYNLGPDVRDWKVNLAQDDIRASGPANSRICTILYRPFDVRHTYYTGRTRGFMCMPRSNVMSHMLTGPANMGLVTTRQTRDEWDVLCVRTIVGHKSLAAYDINTLFPLYLYQDIKGGIPLLDAEPADANGGRWPNLIAEFTEEFSKRLHLSFIPDGKGNLAVRGTFGPEDVFHYMYAVFHSSTYRSRYAEFLKRGFPRLPLTSKKPLFRSLCALGEELVGLHLMEKHAEVKTAYPIAGNNRVEKVRYTEPGQGAITGRVWINKKQYFDNVPPEVWNFHIGGYQVCEKWLKDRKGRELTYDDLTHYQRVVAALRQTIRLMDEIDQTINKHGGWPIE